MNKKPKTQELLAPLTWDDLYEKEHTALAKRITQFKKILRKWDETHDEIQEIPKTDEALMIMYLQKLAIYTSQTRYNEFKENRNIHDQMIKDLDELDDAYIHYHMFDEAKWNLILSQEIAEQISQHIQSEQNLRIFLTRLSLYLQGYIPINNSLFSNEKFITELLSSELASCRYYLEVHTDFCLLLSIGYQKLPKIQYQKNTATSMIYSPFIEVLKVFSEEPEKKELDQLLKKSEELYKNSPSKNLTEEKLDEDLQAKQKLGKKIHFFKYEKQSDDQQQNEIVQKRHPLLFKSRKCVDQEEYQEYLFSLKSYEEAKENLAKKQDYQNQQDEIKKAERMEQFERLKQFFSFSSSRQLIQIYDQIPNKKYKLTDDEKSIVTFDSNVIVIGRSGTGKTLCALLRLFVIEFFFKARETLRMSAEKRPLEAEDIDRIIGLKNVFLTASPYLIKEIKKQYDEMIEHIKAILLENSTKRKAQKLENGQSLEGEQEDLGYGSKLFKEELEYATLDDLIQQFEEKIQRMNCLNDLNEKDFPGFFSIKKFVQMIDGTLEYPMLSKKEQTKKLNLDMENEDNESFELKTKTEEDKNKIMMETEEEQNVGWIEEENDKEQMNHKKDTKKEEKLVEVTYEVFSLEFWPQVPKAYFKVETELTPANIWSEIYSVIKGSYLSHKSHTKYLSKTQYLKLTKKQHTEEYEYKKVVYQIFEYYENWKQKTHHYDFMDLVNHILSDISVYGYQGPMINYLFVDEVQDLPPATMYLVSKIVTNGVFYCGDSAQTIAKGVNFKFGDIPQMFHNKFKLQKIDMPSPVDQQLVVNFRSHNEILQLGHSVITIIEKLFPGSIDKLKSESSSFRGPVPMLLTEINEIKLLNILTTEIQNVVNMDPEYLNEYKRNVPDGRIFKLGPEQIILVRNEQEKKLLPYRLRQGVVLTFEDVKGLEYDDVVLVNFFSSSRYLDKWKLLKCLDMQIEEVKKEEYEQRLKVKEDVAGHHLEDDKSILRSFNWDDNMPNLIERNGKFYYQVPIITYCKDIKGENIKQFYELLTELKILYTAITRARKTFIIYESNIPKQLERLWIKLRVIREVTNENYEAVKDEINQYRRIHKNKCFQNQEKTWIKEGFKWYVRKNYEQAIRCFKNINDMKTAKRIEAEMIANEAAAQMRRIRNQLKNPDNLPKEEFKIKKKMLESLRSRINQKFIRSARLFEEVQRIKNAGQCYYSGEDYKRALECFKKCNFIRGCAECSEALKLYEQAGDYYEKLGKFQKMLFCYEKSKNLKQVQSKLIAHLPELAQSEETCIKYGKLILRVKIQNYLDSNDWLKVKWANKKQLKHQFSPLTQIRKNISRYFVSESLQGLQNVVAVKVKLEFYQKKIESLNKEIEVWQKELQQIDRQFQKQKPFQNLKMGAKFYQLREHELQSGRTKMMSDTCYHDGLRYQDAVLLAQNYNRVKSEVVPLKNKIAQLDDEIKKYNVELGNLQKSRGNIKEIQYLIEKLKTVYEKNKNSSSKEGLKYQIKNININDLKKWGQNGKLNNDKDKEDKFEISSFIDQNFQQQYMSESGLFDQNSEFSIEQVKSPAQIFKSVIFNFSINREHVHNVIFETRDILDKIRKYVSSPLKPPFSDQHHLIIDSKIQSLITKKYPEFKEIINFIRMIERIGEDHLALFTCEFYQLYDLAKRLIVSKIVKMNKMFDKSKKLTKVPFIESDNKNTTQLEVQTFLDQINPKFLNTECFRTLSSKQPILNSVIDTLLMQGLYRNALEFLKDRSEQKIKVSYAFMDYKELYENLLGKISQTNQYKYKQNYVFLSEEKFKNEAKMLNQSSIQEIFFLYDSIQQKPFFKETDWTKSVHLDSHQVSQISQDVQIQMRYKERNIDYLKNQLKEKKRYHNSDLPQKQYEQTKNRQTLLNEARKKYNQKQQEISGLEKIIRQRQQQHQNIRTTIIPNLRKEIKEKEKIIQSFQKEIYTLKQLNRILKPKQAQLILQARCQFYQLSCFVNWSKNWNKNIHPTMTYDLYPEIQINYNLNKKIEQCQNEMYKVNDEITKINRQILSKEKDLPKIREGQQMYQLQLQNYIFERKNFKEKIQLIQDLPQTHQNETLRHKDEINKLEKEIKKEQKQLEHFENDTRKLYFSKAQKQEIYKNKEFYRKKVVDKLKKCAQIPEEYKDGYFSLFMELREQKLTQRAETYTFKKSIKKVIDNCNKNLEDLSTFEQCEMIVLYFSIICYPEKTDIFEYLRNQRLGEQSNRKQQIWKDIQKYEWAIKDIDKLKRQKQGGYYEGIQQRQIKAYQEHIKKLQFDYNNVGYNKSTFSSTYDKMKNMMIKMYSMTENLSEQKDFWFIELMLGFFQCRVIRKCPTLWFLDSEYVIVKSTSVIVKTLLEKNLHDIFCYYLDDNKEFVLLRFANAYLTMKDLIRRKHKDFLYNMGFRDQYAKIRQSKQIYITKDIRDFGRAKTDQNGRNLIFLCNSLEEKDDIQQNYHIFTKKILQREIQTYKESILRFYFSNGFKTAETFHFLQHQLKVLDQNFGILLDCDKFSNMMINALKKKMDNLRDQFDKWKVFVKQHNQITNKSCEDEDSDEDDE